MWIRTVVTVCAIFIAIVHIIWPDLAVDVITLGLFVIAVLPWLAPLVKSFELPGGLKIELQDVERTTDQARDAGLLTPQDTKPELEHSFLLMAEHDPNLALAGLRIEIERRLARLAERQKIQIRSRGLGQLLEALDEQGVLTRDQREALASLTTLLNSAVHGAEVDPKAAMRAIGIAPALLHSIDRLIEPTGPKVLVQSDEPEFPLDGDIWISPDE